MVDHRSGIRLGIGAATLALLVLLALLVAGGAPAGGAADTAVSSHEPRKAASAVENYWTKKRMRNAQPLPMKASEGNSAATAGPTGAPSFVEGAAAGEPSSATLRRGTVSSSAPVPQAQNVPFKRVHIKNPSRGINRTHGKVFFSDGPQNFVCSGTVVNSQRKSAVMTAGHCNHPGGGAAKPWHTNWVFVPGYKNGATPLGTFPAQQLFALNGWINNGNFSFDIGGVVLGKNSAGKKVQAVTGGRGIAFNQPRNQKFKAYGYPAATPFNGQRLYRCDSNFGFSDKNSSNPKPMAIGCDMTGGSSGGGWVIKNEFVNSVNSYKYNNRPKLMFGPYFTDGAKNVYNAIR